MAASLTLLLMFLNFSFVLTIQLLQTGSVNFGRYLFVLFVTLVNAGIVAGLSYFLVQTRMLKVPRSFQKMQKVERIQVLKQERPSHASYRIRRQKAEQDLHDFAQDRKFTMQDVMDVTGFDLMESQNFIDDLILQKSLKAESYKDSFVYYFNDNLKDL